MAVLCDKCDFRMGDIIDGKYTIKRILGEGGFGFVYLVESLDGTVYALKLLKLWDIIGSERTNYLKRFDMEFETGKIKSLYLVHTYTKGFVRGNPYIVMEYCPKGDLFFALENKQISIEQAAINVLFGLHDLHRCGKVHRDLKPENVLVRDDGTAILTDFGIAGDQNNRLTRYNIWGIPKFRAGTYQYMPPEQNRPPKGDAIVLPTTDVFSFGVMMYLLFTGQFPFGKIETEADVPSYLVKGQKGEWNKALLRKNAPKEWMKIIDGCLCPNYKDRIQSVDDILNLLPQKPQHQKDTTILHKGKNFMLRIMQGEEYGKTYHLNDLLNGDKRIITIGRDDGETTNTICLKERLSSYISRCHCTIECDFSHEHWYIRDGQWREKIWRESRNGTYVGSEEITQKGKLLNIGDIITLGDLKMRVEGY